MEANFTHHSTVMKVGHRAIEIQGPVDGAATTPYRLLLSIKLRLLGRFQCFVSELVALPVTIDGSNQPS